VHHRISLSWIIEEYCGFSLNCFVEIWLNIIMMATNVPNVKFNNGQTMPVFGLGTWNVSRTNLSVNIFQGDILSCEIIQLIRLFLNIAFIFIYNKRSFEMREFRLSTTSIHIWHDFQESVPEVSLNRFFLNNGFY
jgi:hypothetical protein